MREILSTPGSGVWFRKVLKGAIAGFVATAPMSISMLIGWRLLPTEEKYHLPPRLITEAITERAGIEDRLGETELVGLTIFSHFGYGALFGAFYGLLEHKLPIHASLKGALSGAALWVGSDGHLVASYASSLAAQYVDDCRSWDLGRDAGRGHAEVDRE
jgi:hypothetical protein